MDLFDVVAIKASRPELGLKALAQGTILEIYPDGAFEVEFFDPEASSSINIGLRPDEVMAVPAAESSSVSEHSENLSGNFSQLIQAVQLLALAYPQQVELFPPYAVPADELAITFANTADAWQELKQRDYLSESMYRILTEMQRTLKKIGALPKGSGWSSDALQVHPHWQEVRALASLFLTEGQLPIFEGKLDNMRYI